MLPHLLARFPSAPQLEAEAAAANAAREAAEAKASENAAAAANAKAEKEAQPKKALSAYMIFSAEARPRHKEVRGGAHPRSLPTLLRFRPRRSCARRARAVC